MVYRLYPPVLHIARALILNPCLILADEPTGNLDSKNRDMIMHLLRREHEKGRGIILITHDMQTAREADTVYALEGGILHAMKNLSQAIYVAPGEVFAWVMGYLAMGATSMVRSLRGKVQQGWM